MHSKAARRMARRAHLSTTRLTSPPLPAHGSTNDSTELWIGIYLPLLPLEVYVSDRHSDRARVIGIGHGRQQRVLVCDRLSGQLGIYPGMRIGAAHALAEGLEVCVRDESAEGLALRNIAAWCGQFTPTISLAPPDAILLEVAGSFALFGGTQSLVKQVRNGIADLGYRTHLALAPTPLATTLFARARKNIYISNRAGLTGRLANLPLEVLKLADKDLAKLNGMGLRTIGDCLRLPRAGLARRMTPSLVRILDHALGKAPDPRPRFEPEPRFESQLPLSNEVEDTESLLFAARRQLSELTAFLRARCGGVQAIVWKLHHRRQQATVFTLGLLTPSRDLRQLSRLMQERLERIEISAPVQALTLMADKILPLAGATIGLLPHSEPSDEEDWTTLLERLRARLGTEAVLGLRLAADHRPEYAWRPCQPGDSGPDLDVDHRPLWLMAKPLQLAEREGQLIFRDKVLNLQGRERIESGWWDGKPIARDYFIATDPMGTRYWVYRELKKSGKWFLHGVF